jgi:hypothetical protein
MALSIELATGRMLRHLVAQSRGRSPLYAGPAALAGAARQLGDSCLRHRLQCVVWSATERSLHVVLQGIPGAIALATHEIIGHRLRRGHWLSTIVQHDVYLLEVARHALLAPIRAGHCRRPADWPYSSARESFGLRPAPGWIDLDPLYALLGAQQDTGPLLMRRFMQSR